MIKSQITFKQLEALVFVVDTGTFRGAALVLGTTQPNISARIAALEATLETTLLNRDAGSVRLTETGMIITQKARDVIWAGEVLLQEARRQDLIEERLRLGVTELVASTWLREFLRQLRALYPKLRVELEVDLSTAIDQRLSQRQLDLAFQTGPFKSTAMTQINLGTESYCWVAHPNRAFELGDSPTVGGVFQHPIITHAKHTQAGQAIQRLAVEHGLDAGQVIHCSALSVCLPMILENLGLGLLPEVLLHEHLSSGELVKISSEWLPAPLSFAARYDAGRAGLFVAKAAGLAVDAMAAHQHALHQEK